MSGLARYRHTFTDARRRRVLGGRVVFSTRHAASGPNTPDLRVPADLVDGAVDVRLPPGTYQLHARLHTVDGSLLELSSYVTLEAS